MGRTELALEQADARAPGRPAALAAGGAPAGVRPVEGLWANLKALELANFAGDQVAEVADQAQCGIERVCASQDLVIGFLAHTGLTLDQEVSP